MGVLEGFQDGLRFMLGMEPRNVRELEQVSVDEQVQRIWRRRIGGVSTADAMSVPAVFKAVSLISNTIGTFSMEAFRDSAKLSLPDTPQLVKRPNPWTVPYEFWRNSAYYRARYGETWWWVAKRDIDLQPLSLIPIDPREIQVRENERDPRPSADIITWRNREYSREDMRQSNYLPDPNNPLRGIGPLQACGAAVTVAVEAMEWAGNFFAESGIPSVWVKSAVPFTDDQLKEFEDRWSQKPAGTPRITGPTVEDVQVFGATPESAQLVDVKQAQNGDVALMFSMPATLLNHGVAGSSITYQNVSQVNDDLLRQCLLPHYMEPMEQMMSDLLPRSTIGRFNTSGFLRADPMTRAQVHNLLVPLGIETVPEARSAEGYAPGDVENRPIPLSPPLAIPAAAPFQQREAPLRDIRHECGNLVGRVSGAAELWCRHCKQTMTVAA